MSTKKLPEGKLNLMLTLALCVAIFFLFMAIRPAHATEWKTEFDKCNITIVVPKEDKDLPYKRIREDTDNITVVILAEQVPEILGQIEQLKKCNAFWKCVRERDVEHKVKHCYDNDRRWR